MEIDIGDGTDRVPQTSGGATEDGGSAAWRIVECGNGQAAR